MMWVFHTSIFNFQSTPSRERNQPRFVAPRLSCLLPLAGFVYLFFTRTYKSTRYLHTNSRATYVRACSAHSTFVSILSLSLSLSPAMKQREPHAVLFVGLCCCCESRTTAVAAVCYVVGRVAQFGWLKTWSLFHTQASRPSSRDGHRLGCVPSGYCTKPMPQNRASPCTQYSQHPLLSSSLLLLLLPMLLPMVLLMRQHPFPRPQTNVVYVQQLTVNGILHRPGGGGGGGGVVVVLLLLLHCADLPFSKFTTFASLLSAPLLLYSVSTMPLLF